MEHRVCEPEDALLLAEIRAVSMRESLEAIGRYDDTRVRRWFLDTYSPRDTVKLMEGDRVIGFYVVRDNVDYLHLDHLYVTPEYQSMGIGRRVVEQVLSVANDKGIPVKLRALKGSRANQFYTRLGFKKTHIEAFDEYYESTPCL